MATTSIDFSGDFKTKLNEVIDGMFAQRNVLTRNQRMYAVQLYTDAYVAQTGVRPAIEALDRMATLILNEEITDPDVYKMTRNEYPIMSDRQSDRRKEGEISFQWADEVGVDGRDYRPKTRENNRKMRDVMNGNLRDKDAHSRNKERRDRYREFTKVQPVIEYNVSDTKTPAP